MEHLLQKSKCSIFHNIFKYMIFIRRRKVLLWSKGLNPHADVSSGTGLKVGHSLHQQPIGLDKQKKN